MIWLAMALLAAQGLVLLVDEFYYHRRRGLGRWELLGHPLDTLVTLTPLLFALNTMPTNSNLGIFAALSLFSCLFVTKDEWVHAKECPAGEHWLHALLFTLHPLMLASLGYLWWADSAETPTRTLLVGQATLMLLFLTYQLWGISHGLRRLKVRGNQRIEPQNLG